MVGAGWWGMAGSSIGEVFTGKLDHPFRRAGWLMLAVPAVTIKLLVDGVCLLLDELLYPGAKQTKIREPVFVVGPPRSGTTFLHRVLARDDTRFVTTPAWEVLLAPSVVQKKCFRALRSLDRALGGLFARSFRWLEKKALSAFNETHPGSLTDPEEDYFYLSSVCACTGWILAFPACRGLRKFMPGQPECSDAHRRAALGFYKSCLQKQLFVDGGQRTVLSKNASFASWMDLLPEHFPDARFIVCMRDPAEAVPSMLSTAEASVRAAYASAGPNRLQDVLNSEMRAHYRTLSEVIPEMGPNAAVVVLQSDLTAHLGEVLRRCSEELFLEFSPGFWQQVDLLSAQSRTHRSKHSYNLAEFGLSAENLRESCPTLEPTLSHDQP